MLRSPCCSLSSIQEIAVCVLSSRCIEAQRISEFPDLFCCEALLPATAMTLAWSLYHMCSRACHCFVLPGVLPSCICCILSHTQSNVELHRTQPHQVKQLKPTSHLLRMQTCNAALCNVYACFLTSQAGRCAH